MQETIAMLGVLADSGLPATTAGVAVRNILIDISRSSSKLATAIGHPVRNLDELTEALEDLKRRGGNGLEFVSSLVEKRVVPGFTTLMNNTAKMRDLRNSITDVKDELQEMADKQINTLKDSGAVFLQFVPPERIFSVPVVKQKVTGHFPVTRHGGLAIPRNDCAQYP